MGAYEDSKLKHPALIQFRGHFDRKRVESMLSKQTGNYEVEMSEHGLDVYFEDVNDARFFISKLKKNMRFKQKLSINYAGLRKGRVRKFFVYSLRFDDEAGGILRTEK
jgi:NMD protein affecting ribosome stability and mRNA decay